MTRFLPTGLYLAVLVVVFVTVPDLGFRVFAVCGFWWPLVVLWDAESDGGV